MKTTLYIDRDSPAHRLHPTLKVFGLFMAFWSVYWVDNPIALLPVLIVVAALAQVIGAWENVWRFRWFLHLDSRADHESPG